MTCRTASTHTKGKNGEILLIHWSRRLISPSCGEPSKELMAEQNVRQRTKQLPSMEAHSLCPNNLQPGSTNSSKLASVTRLVTRETKRKSLEMAQRVTTDLVRRAIKICRNSKAFGPDKLSIFHLKHLGPRAIEYITALFNLSVTTCQIPAIWKSSLIIPIPKPGKDTSIGTISLLCPATKVLECLILPTINKYIQPAPDQITRPPQFCCR